MVYGICFFYVGSVFVDYNGQFYFLVGFFVVFGDDDVIVGAVDCSGGFEEQDRGCGYVYIVFFGVLGIVEFYVDNF